MISKERKQEFRNFLEGVTDEEWRCLRSIYAGRKSRGISRGSRKGILHKQKKVDTDNG